MRYVFCCCYGSPFAGSSFSPSLEQYICLEWSAQHYPFCQNLCVYIDIYWHMLHAVDHVPALRVTTCMYYYFTSYWAVLLWYGGAVVCHRYIRSCIRRSVCGSIDLHNNYTSCTVHVSCYVYNAHVHCIYMLWVTSLPFRFYPHSNANHYVAIPLGVLHCEFMYLFAIALCSPGAF